MAKKDIINSESLKQIRESLNNEIVELNISVDQKRKEFNGLRSRDPQSYQLEVLERMIVGDQVRIESDRMFLGLLVRNTSEIEI